MQQPLIGRGALTHGLRSVAIAEQNVEVPLGLFEIVIGQRVETIQFLRREAEGAVRGHHGPERAFHFLAVAALEDDQRGAQQRDFLIQFVDILVVGDRLQFLERARPVFAQFRSPDARERRIAFGSVLGDSVESGRCLLSLAFVGERDRGFKTGVRGFRRFLTVGLVIAPRAGRSDDQHGEDQDRRVIAPPKVRRLVAPDIFIDLMENIGHVRQTLDSARKNRADRSR